MAALFAVGYFLISSLFGLIIVFLWLRIALHYCRISSLNAFYQLIHKLTNPIVEPINFLFKQTKLNVKYDWSSFGVLVLVEFLKVVCLSLLVLKTMLPFITTVLTVALDLIVQPLDLLFYALLIRVILQFANPNWNHPFGPFLFAITEPLFNIGRRLISPISGFDFSPFVMMLILKIISLALSNILPGRLF
ncbi:MAG: YggT family protein [Legionella sp.]|nr:YggT family protein [Legionella sp.]